MEKYYVENNGETDKTRASEKYVRINENWNNTTFELWLSKS